MQGRLHDDPFVSTIAAPGAAYCCVQCVTQSDMVAGALPDVPAEG
jgi:hypothetical protein